MTQYVKTVSENGTTTRKKVGVAGAAADLAPLLGMTVQEVTDKLTGTRPFNYVAKGITPLTWRKIKALGINGIDAEATSKRSYPTSTTAASLVGFVRRRRATRRRPRAADGQAAAGQARHDDATSSRATAGPSPPTPQHSTPGRSPAATSG